MYSNTCREYFYLITPEYSNTCGEYFYLIPPEYSNTCGDDPRVQYVIRVESIFI